MDTFNKVPEIVAQGKVVFYLKKRQITIHCKYSQDLEGNIIRNSKPLQNFNISF